MRFLTGVWHLDHDLNELKNLACILPDFFISLRLVTGKIDVLVEAQFSSEKLCQGWLGGWVGGWSVGQSEIKANSASVAVEVEAELGKIVLGCC